MQQHRVDLTERELRTILAAMDLARDPAANQHGWRWWHKTKYAEALYRRLRDHPQQSVVESPGQGPLHSLQGVDPGMSGIFEALRRYVMVHGGPERHDLLIAIEAAEQSITNSGAQ